MISIFCSQKINVKTSTDKKSNALKDQHAEWLVFCILSAQVNSSEMDNCKYSQKSTEEWILKRSK
jgi:hypothetical protein